MALEFLALLIAADTSSGRNVGESPRGPALTTRMVFRIILSDWCGRTEVNCLLNWEAIAEGPQCSRPLNFIGLLERGHDFPDNDFIVRHKEAQQPLFLEGAIASTESRQIFRRSEAIKPEIRSLSDSRKFEP